MSCKIDCPFSDKHKVTPFSNGSDYWHWQSKNCSECINYDNESKTEKEAKCPIAFFLDLASVTDGTISLSIAKAMGVKTYNPLYSYVELSDTCRMKKTENDFDLPF